ncbi:MAG: nuclear transport factor 2 family protein [Propionibacteriaceae bacterium]
MRELTEQFISALHQLHADSDATALVALFSADATLTKLGDHNEAHGADGAEKFWQDYRAVFADIEATFTHTTADESTVALEWTSTGSLANGHPLSYSGVSVLEGDGEQISGFRTYYDSAAFLGEGQIA